MLKRPLFISASWMVLLVFWALPALADIIVDTAWVRTYNGPGNAGDGAYAIAVDGSDNVCVTGQSYDSGTFWDLVIIKYYPHGDTAWVRRYNGPGNADDGAYAIAVDGHNNVYVTGKGYYSETGYDFVTIKYYSDGDTAWLKTYNGPGNENDFGRDITVDDSGYVYVTGWSYGSGTNSDFAIIKYHPHGDTAWVRRYNGSENGSDYPSAIAVDDSSYVYVTGYGGTSPYNYDYVTIKYYPDGDTVWLRRYNGPVGGNDQAYAMTIDGYGNVYVTGESEGTGYTPDYLTVKYYPNGDTAWTRRYDGPGQLADEANDIGVDASGNVFVTGVSFGGWVTRDDFATIKYYPNGDTAWVRRYIGSGTGDDCANDLLIDGFGNIYVTGFSGSGEDVDYATIKYYPNGDTAWVRKYNGSGKGNDRAFALVNDGFGNVYVTGYSYGSGTAEDCTTIKYFQALRGDVNRDGMINSADVVYLLNYLFIGGPAPVPLGAGDANCDGVINSADVVYLINYLFIGGPPPCEQ